MDRTAQPRIDPLTITLLIAAPALMVVARLLLVPFDDQDWDKVLTDAAANQGRSSLGWLLSMAACGLLTVGAVGLARVAAAAGRTRAAAIATVTIALGWAGASAISAAGLLFSYQGQSPDRASQIDVLTKGNAGHTAFIFLMCVIGAIGYIVLAVALRRAGAASKVAASLLALGGLTTLLTTPGPARPLLVAAALLLLAGQSLVVRALNDRSAAPLADDSRVLV